MIYRKNTFLTSIIFSLLLCAHWATSQTLKEWKNQQKEQFQNFKNKIQGDLDNYKKQQRKKLKEFIKMEKRWNEITTGSNDFTPRKNTEERDTNPIKESETTRDLKKGEVSKTLPIQPEENKKVKDVSKNLPIQPEENKKVKDISKNLLIQPEENKKVKPKSPVGNPDLPNYSKSAIPARYPLPTAAGRITSQFGYRKHPVYKYRKFHYGIDIAAPRGTKVYSTAVGRVKQAGKVRGYGNYIVIEHSNGYKTAYAHLSRIRVAVGEKVSAGTFIGNVGKSGNTTGNHLHYEVILNNRKVNPRKYWK